MTDSTALTARDIVVQLDQARRDSRRATIDFWEAIYQAYLAGFSIAFVAMVVASILPQDEIGATALADVAARGPALLGGLVAFAAYLGLRSGVQGGPLVFEAATVQYVLQSPVDRPFVARRAALKQLRTALLWGIGGGFALGLAVSGSLPGNWFEFGVGFGIVGALTGITLFGTALVASGRRLPSLLANAVGVALVAWSVTDVVFASTTSPFTLVGRIGLWSLSGTVVSSIGIVLVVAIVFEGLRAAGGMSLEASQRRAGLISQIRFALTMRDLRTVVLLRRRLTGRSYRSRAWLPVGHSAGNRLPTIRRTVHSVLRMPLPALIRTIILGIGAGAALAIADHGVAALALLPGLLLFVAAYDFIEPLSQEIDHPVRWAAHPMEPGDLVLSLTAAGAVVMVPLALLATLTATAVAGLHLLGVAVAVFLLGILAAVVGAAVSTVLGGSEVSTSAMAGSEVFGISVVLRIVLPPAVALLPFVPVTAALATAGPPGDAISNSVVLVGASCGVAWLWLRTRKPGLS